MITEQLLEELHREPDREAAARRALEHNPGWYHTIDLAPGVSTPGFCDLRGLIAQALPTSLAGRRCLDVGTFDGFYAFAMEERGAAEVVGIDVASSEDLEHPPLRREANLAEVRRSGAIPGQGFRVAAAVRRSAARRVVCNVYDLTPEAIGGPVDFVVIGTILQHLRDPVRALERVRNVLSPGGEGVLVETISLPLTLAQPRAPAAEFRPAMPGNKFSWWVPNLALVKGWPVSAGLVVEGRPRIFRPLHRLGAAADRRHRLAVVRVKAAD